MVNSISEADLYLYKQKMKEYKEKRRRKALAGFVLASAASGIVMKTLPPFSKPFINQMSKEIANDTNYIYKDVFEKAVKNSGLREKGLWIRDVGVIEVLNKLKGKQNIQQQNEVQKGLNAYYSPAYKNITLNCEKASMLGFHELGHAANHLDSKFGKLLQQCRKPGYTIAGLMGTVALFSKTKPKGEKRNFFEFIQDNCAKIAFISMLPVVAEEALASHKGIKFAKKAGLAKDGVKNLRLLYGKALLTYFGYALVTGLSVFAASKIMDVFTRPKKKD